MSESRTLHVLIRGRVQGVSFRAWTQHQAELHGLKGWVRNRRDGSVEAVFSGPADLVQVMLKACHQGPAGAVVETIETLDGSEGDRDLPTRFEIRRTT
ncbi:acylphosphatase [Microvirga terrestris]|uniref:Acylphosphatase n=1 Tax=Microvirga terrestris TaxID=2791024 RepID=A0ABS0HWK1_9HYPH|nr:acylphosphatase [Microvirga terrestris]MBF9197858.1 acylphosphatase [Microvirga terrestris]